MVRDTEVVRTLRGVAGRGRCGRGEHPGVGVAEARHEDVRPACILLTVVDGRDTLMATVIGTRFL